MQRVSQSMRELGRHYETVVVGSGYGGGVAASRLARAGHQVCVLERGRELVTGEYPDTAVELAKQVQADFPDKHVGSRTALFDFRYNEDINVIVGCGVGGTSLINANINEPPDPRVYQDPIWPARVRADAAAGRMAEFSALADAMLEPSLYPVAYPRVDNHRVLEAITPSEPGQFTSARINVSFERRRNHAGVEQAACVNCGDCISGCNYGAKNTVLMNYLPDAKNHGASIFAEVRVDHVRRRNGRWAIHLGPTRGSAGESRILSADRVVLAAGTLGSTEILLRSRDHGLALSAALGKRFSGNGDMLSIGYNTEHRVNAVGYGEREPTGRKPVGPAATAIIDIREHKPVNQGMVLTGAILPGALAPFMAKSLSSLALLTTGQDSAPGWRARLRRRARELRSLIAGAYTGAVANSQFMLSVSHDDSGGELYLEDDRIRVRWPGAGEQPALQAANRVMRDKMAPLDGTYIQNPVWNDLTDQSLITGHPLGGCAMADSAERGVVNHFGQVYRSDSGTEVHVGLYVMDGSVIPRAVGINPLNAITALAERSCFYLLNQAGPASRASA